MASPENVKSADDAVIRADEAYPIENFRRRNSMGKHALRMARRAGLRVLRVGRQSFVLGRDWIEFVDKNGRRV